MSTLHCIFLRKKLITLDNLDLFEFIDHAKTTLMMVDSVIIVILKIPMLKPKIYEYLMSTLYLTQIS